MEFSSNYLRDLLQRSASTMRRCCFKEINPTFFHMIGLSISAASVFSVSSELWTSWSYNLVFLYYHIYAIGPLLSFFFWLLFQCFAHTMAQDFINACFLLTCYFPKTVNLQKTKKLLLLLVIFCLYYGLWNMTNEIQHSEQLYFKELLYLQL